MHTSAPNRGRARTPPLFQKKVSKLTLREALSSGFAIVLSPTRVQKVARKSAIVGGTGGMASRGTTPRTLHIRIQIRIRVVVSTRTVTTSHSVALVDLVSRYRVRVRRARRKRLILVLNLYSSFPSSSASASASALASCGMRMPHWPSDKYAKQAVIPEVTSAEAF